jgi:hypothetical protein
MKSIYIPFFLIFFALFNSQLLNAEVLKTSNKATIGAETQPEIDVPNTPQTIYHSISGHVYKEGSNDRFEGVTIELSGGIGSVVTDSLGFYSIDVPRSWSGVAIPSYCGFYGFTPGETFYTNVKKDYFDQDYTGAPSTTFTISGKFSTYDTGEPISNTDIDFGNGITITTNNLGEYSIEVLPCISDTLTPYLDGYNFNPGSRIYQQINVDYTNQDYIGTPDSFGLPPGWDYDNTGTVHIISVFTSSDPNLCGVPIQQGDYLGVFYTDGFGELRCGGAGMWTGTSNTPIIAQGDDQTTPEKDGFAYGETFTWKIYRWTDDQKEYIAIPDYQCGGFLVCNNKWYVTGLSIVEELDIYEQQFIEIPAGWSGFSGYLDPISPLVTNTMAPILSQLVIMQTLTKMYYPGQNINTIGLWNDYSGYKIKVNSDVLLPIMGCPLTASQLNLSTTWNLIPVTSKCNVQLAELLAPVINKVIVVKEIGGNNIFWPAMGISTLKTLLPGKSYMVAVSQSAQVSFPVCSGNLKNENFNADDFTNNTPWNDPVPTASNHNIAIKAIAMHEIEVGDYIGAFTKDGYCAGLTQVNDINQNQAITLYGDDVTTSVNDGFTQDEPLFFKVYRASSKKEFKLMVNYDQTLSSNNGLYDNNGLSAIDEILFDPTSINGLSEQNFVIFPNPSTGKFELISGDNKRQYNINVLGMDGKSVFSYSTVGNTSINLGGLQKGIYILKIEGTDFVKYEKLILE